MAPSKPFPSVSRIIDERFEQKAMEIHLRKLEAVKAVVDTSEPQYMHHLDHNAKKAERDAERQLEIEQENARLFNKLSAIEDFDSTKVLRASVVRSSLNSKPGMYYSTVGGYQCVDHINLTATSNPRSLHYKGPSMPASHSSTRAPSRATTRPVSPESSMPGGIGGGGEGSASMDDWESTPYGVGHGAMRGGADGAEAQAEAEADLASLGLVQRSSSASGAGTGAGAGAGSGRLLRPPPGPGRIPGAAYLAASVPPPAPPKSSAMGSQPWSGQLSRPHRTTGDSGVSGSIDFGAGTRSGYRLSTSSSFGGAAGIGRHATGEEGGPPRGLAGECSLPLIGRSSLRVSRDGRDSLQTSADLPASSDGSDPAGGDASLAARLLAQPPTAPPPPRSRPGPSRGPSSNALRASHSFDPTSSSSPYASPHRPPRPAAPVSRGGSPSRVRASRCDAPLPPGARGLGDVTASREFSVSSFGGGGGGGGGSRGASPLRRSMQGDVDLDASGASYSFAPDHGLRKEMLKLAYLQGANVQAKGNTVMATRRSNSHTSLRSAGTSPNRAPRYSNSMDDDDL